ncbi:MAG TPA: ankyrin repeat domain-containing protein [Terriglobales bacterium]|nr:ankyrin repeat domain-containing protein [Terriglobales bacterium]
MLRLALLGALLLVLAGCSPRKNIDELNRQLLRAARTGDTALAQKLLREGANIESTDLGGSTPLAIAVDYGHMETAKMLLQKGSSLANAGLAGDDAFIESARNGSVYRVQFLLVRNPSTKEKNDALFASAETAPARVAVVDDAKVSAGVPQDNGVLLEEGKIANLLLANGAELEARDVEGATPLIRAAEFGNSDVVKVLLDHGADIEARDNNGQTSLIAAACECASIDMPETIDVLKLLVAKKADVNANDKDGETALMAAAAAGETSNVLFLLDSGAQMNARDHDGDTALMLAAGAGPYNAVRALETTDAAKLLFARGADTGIRNKHGQTALNLAVKSGRNDVAALLRNAAKH